MTQKEILEYNKRCAEFLGETEQPYEFSKFGKINTKGDWVDTFFINELKFHSDWNWIMEVIKKIGDIPFSKNPGLREYINNNFNEWQVHIFSEKEEVVQAINKFLIWYNEQIQTNQ